MNKKIIWIIALVLLNLAYVNAQENIVSRFEKIPDLEDYSLKISFHSWGEGRTEQLNLDKYFPIKRNPNSRYVYLAPPEISIKINQDNGIAELQAFKDWTGTKEIIFSLTEVYKLEAAVTNLQKYREEITQKRAPIKLKDELKDLPTYYLLEKVLDNLEAEKLQSSKIEILRDDNNIKVNIGLETKLEINLETRTENNIKTLRPRINVRIQPEAQAAEEVSSGLSLFIFIPLIIIAVILLVVGAIYLIRNKEKLKKLVKKKKTESTKADKLNKYKKQLIDIHNKLNKQSEEKSINEIFSIIKGIFNEITKEGYQFSYSEIKKDQIEKGLDEKLKEKICKFSKDISDIRFSGEKINVQELAGIIKSTEVLITNVLKGEKQIQLQIIKEKKNKTTPMRMIKYILDSFKNESTRKKAKLKVIKKEEMHEEQEKKKLKELRKLERKEKLRKFLHDNLGLFKTREEIEIERLARIPYTKDIEHKATNAILRALTPKLEKKRLTIEQEIEILMKIEEEAIKEGDIEKSKDILKKIEKKYKKLRKSKHQPKWLLKLKNSLIYIKENVSMLKKEAGYQSAGRIDMAIAKIRKMLTPEIENAKLDQINFLVDRAERRIRRDNKQEAKEFYQRAVSLYKSMNRVTKKLAMPSLLSIKNEVTSMAISDSLEKAFSAIYTGQVKKAQKLYQNIDANFTSLTTNERKKLYDQKEELYQRIKEQKNPEKNVKSAQIKHMIGRLFTREDNGNEISAFADGESRYKQKQIEKKIKEKEQKRYLKKESLKDFILARKPKFTSIKTEISGRNYNLKLTKKLFGYISRAEYYISRNNHKEAYHNFKMAVDLFKDVELEPEIRDNVYSNLNGIKKKILHTSLHNFFKETKKSLKREEIEKARKSHTSLHRVYNHIYMKNQKKISELARRQRILVTATDPVIVERRLDQAFAAIRSNNQEEAVLLYNTINNYYNNLSPEDKMQIYPKLSALYSELIRIRGNNF
ncbi:hypothetical protein HYT56_00620 [Candidatus Woesearchaeota archaeon]|nr:hypothetical protein [Candidatus Woesearchaeota archaeon]